VNATPANVRFLGATLVAPGLGILTLFLFVPLALIVGLSDLTYSPTKIWLPVLTAVNYEKFFHPYYLGVMWTTIGHDWRWTGPRVARLMIRRASNGSILSGTMTT